MKVPVSTVEVHLLPFLKKIASSMPSTLHKWISGVMIAAGAGKIDGFLKGYAGQDGMIDLDVIRKLVESGFEASGGDVVIPFGIDALSALGVSPVNVRITKADVDQLLAEIKG